MISILAVLVFTAAVTTQSDGAVVSKGLRENELVTWVTGNGINKSQLEPAGEGWPRDYGTIYVSRAFVQGGWIPGKGFFRNNLFRCAVGLNGKEIDMSGSQCQALIAPAGHTKWVTKQNTIPTSAIVAGYDSKTSVPIFVCRGVVVEFGMKFMLVGKLLQGRNTCLIPHWGETPVNEYEVLVSTPKNSSSQTCSRLRLLASSGHL